MAMTAAYLDRPSTHFDEADVDVDVDVESNLRNGKAACRDRPDKCDGEVDRE